MPASGNHIGLLTADPHRLIAFYTEKLGFQEGESRIVSTELMLRIFDFPGACRMTKLKLGDVTLELFAPEEVDMRPAQRDAAGYNHWGLSVKDKMEFCRRAEERGAEVIRVEYRDRWILFIKDPEGNRIEVFDG